MPPKKGAAAGDQKPIIMGRIGTNLKCGVVGLPNVGKSTFFNLLTKSQAAAENFPFCTIDPNDARVAVPDERYDWLCEFYKPLSRVPAYLNVTDIAGLVKGAHEGQGLGNAFLSHVKACDAMFQMVRIFEDDDVTHIEGDVNPIRDIDIIMNELRLKDVEYLKKQVEVMAKNASRGGADKKLKTAHEVMVRVLHVIDEEQTWVRFREWNAVEAEIINEHLLLTCKPIVYLLNMTEKDYIKKKNKWLMKIKEWVDQNDPGAAIIPFSGSFELKIFEMPDDERARYLEELKTTSALNKIIVQGYKALRLECFFTVGKDEVRAWTIQKGTKAPQAAGRVHTDMEKGFIMAEVFKYDDLKSEGSEAAVKAAGKYLQKGREYVVIDGDIVLIKFNAGAGLTAGKKK